MFSVFLLLGLLRVVARLLRAGFGYVSLGRCLFGVSHVVVILDRTVGFVLMVSYGFCTRSPSVLRCWRPFPLLEHARDRRPGHLGGGARVSSCARDRSHSGGLLKFPPGYEILLAEFCAGISATRAAWAARWFTDLVGKGQFP